MLRAGRHGLGMAVMRTGGIRVGSIEGSGLRVKSAAQTTSAVGSGRSVGRGVKGADAAGIVGRGVKGGVGLMEGSIDGAGSGRRVGSADTEGLAVSSGFVGSEVSAGLGVWVSVAEGSCGRLVGSAETDTSDPVSEPILGVCVAEAERWVESEEGAASLGVWLAEGDGS